jgi:type III restriction enzyme
VVEIKGYRGEDAKEKKRTMDTYWIPGVNHLGTYGRWAFRRAESGFAAEVEARYQRSTRRAVGRTA